MVEPVKLVVPEAAQRDQEIGGVIDRLAEMHEANEIECIVVYAVLRNGQNYLNNSSTGDHVKRIGGMHWAIHRMTQQYDVATDDHT